ncbi:AAA family ATPase [Methylacidimicrobium sp. B4]|uniref:AAA family ATPase n=1 Tax=Methylacidimicrobium sp. B4 TaxID=2796139 RepID=UPI001A8D7ECA|nr:AAA family ATPase [Methylacidimicrobium sp. B4]QSR85492.1 AAA family ATPase [Methylacidimicrobium sp. B4]
MEEAEKESQATPPAAAADGSGLVDLDQALGGAGVGEILTELDAELIGLAPVKRRVREVADFLLVERLRSSVGLQTQAPTLHMSFTGSPGTGKTTVALRMGKILHRLGYVRKGHLVVAARDDLVGQYVGHTAPKTKEAIKRAMGGVLFIDEAYSLYRPESERDYGLEAVAILLQAMEDYRNDLVVIFAGYRDRMAAFFSSNPGLRSRIAHHIDFPDYTFDELVSIGDLMVRSQGYFFDPAAAEAFREYLELRRKQPLFANARSVRNAIDRIKLRQAARLVAAGGKVPAKELMRIDESDIRQSRVFIPEGREGETVGKA